MIENNYRYISDLTKGYKIDNVYNSKNNIEEKNLNTIQTKKDTIELSINSNFENMRIEKINNLKQSIAKGEYSVNSRIIANAMLENLKTLK